MGDRIPAAMLISHDFMQYDIPCDMVESDRTVARMQSRKYAPRMSRAEGNDLSWVLVRST